MLLFVFLGIGGTERIMVDLVREFYFLDEDQ
jgi:hypothetical protein